MLPSATTLGSVASQKRLIAFVITKVGSLDAQLRGDQDASIFEPLGDVDPRRRVHINARLAFLYNWLCSQLTGPCVEIDRYRARQGEHDSFGFSRRAVRVCRRLASDAVPYQ
jgi:hypothetical protein